MIILETHEWFLLILLALKLYLLKPRVYLQKKQRNVKSETSQNHLLELPLLNNC